MHGYQIFRTAKAVQAGVSYFITWGVGIRPWLIKRSRKYEGLGELGDYDRGIDEICIKKKPGTGLDSSDYRVASTGRFSCLL